MMFKGTMENFHREAHKGREGPKDLFFFAFFVSSRFIFIVA